MKTYLEYRDAKSAKFWEITVDGSSYTVRFGKIGTAGQSKAKTLHDAQEARDAAATLIAQKRTKGYTEVGGAGDVEAPLRELSGAVFYAASDGVTANAVLAEMRGDGKTSRNNGRKLAGLSEDGLVGVAIHTAEDGTLAVVDSADGCQGIGSGEGSRVALIANHLGTDAIWCRAFSNEVALAVRFRRGGSFFEAFPGTRAAVRAWLEAQGLPVAVAVPPRDAGSEATIATIQYTEPAYRKGPDVEVASRLVAIGDALRAGDAETLRALCEREPLETLPLALGVIRAADHESSSRAIAELATTILREPLRPRTKPKEMTLDEEILRRAAEGGEDAVFHACVERLDAIERDAEERSDWAHPGGIARLAYHYVERDPARAFECYRRLAVRSEPHWIHVNMALAMLAKSSPPAISIVFAVKELVDRTEAFVKGLGEEARDAVLYNLACVHARGGDAKRALDALRRCKSPRKQNPRPEADPDFESLWGNETFRTLIGPAPAVDADVAVDEDEESGVDEGAGHVPPPDRVVPRQTIRLRKGGDPKALVSRIGGLPNAPSGTDWPDAWSRPMRFVLQLVGKKAGGDVDLGDVSVLSVFADLDGDYYEPSCQAVMLHRGRCDDVLSPPVGVETDEVRVIDLEPGQDDRILSEHDWIDEWEPQHAEWTAARRHAWADKLWGVPVGGNLDPDERDSEGRPMKCLLQLVSYDDWFLWYLFVSADFTEARLQVVRG